MGINAVFGLDLDGRLRDWLTGFDGHDICS
jgi:hypothetical protein